MSGDFENANRNRLTHQTLVTVEHDDTITMRPARQLYQTSVIRTLVDLRVRTLTRPFDQNLHGLTEKLLIVLFADFVLNVQQFVVASLLNLKRNVIRHSLSRLGSWAFAILKDETVFETAFFDQFHRFLKFIFGFTREPNDKVARNRSGIAERFIDPCHHVAIIGDRVASFHPLQNRIASALQRHMQVR